MGKESSVSLNSLQLHDATTDWVKGTITIVLGFSLLYVTNKKKILSDHTISTTFTIGLTLKLHKSKSKNKLTCI